MEDMGESAIKTRLKAALRHAFMYASRLPLLRKAVFWSYTWWSRKSGTDWSHPYDKSVGIEAGGFVPSYLLQSGKRSDGYNVAYLGVLPSLLRTALSQIPDASARVFYDLGCGKGRALAVASEFPFRRVIGIELQPDLCRAAAQNARALRARYPERALIEVIEGDASSPPLDESPAVVFMFHPFHEGLVRLLAKRMSEMAYKADVFLVYMNPVYGAIFDDDPAFDRFYAEQLRVSSEQRAY